MKDQQYEGGSTEYLLGIAQFQTDHGIDAVEGLNNARLRHVERYGLLSNSDYVTSVNETISILQAQQQGEQE